LNLTFRKKKTSPVIHIPRFEIAKRGHLRRDRDGHPSSLVIPKSRPARV